METEERLWSGASVSGDGSGWVLISGATAGLGVALAHRLGSKGRNLILIARRQELLEANAGDLSRRYGVRVVPVVLDLTDTEAIVPVIEELLQRYQLSPEAISLVINCAGSGFYGSFVEEEPEAMHRAIRLNINAPAELSRWIIPYFRRKGSGTICNVASVAAFTPGPLMASYYAAKAWMLSFGESLAEELRRDGIRVVTCCPGPFQSEFHGNAGIDEGTLGAVPSAERVAAAVIGAIERGRSVAPIGLAAKAWALVGPRLPRRWSRKIIGYLQGRRRSS